jgi:hypothetical protein
MMIRVVPRMGASNVEHDGSLSTTSLASTENATNPDGHIVLMLKNEEHSIRMCCALF